MIADDFYKSSEPKTKIYIYSGPGVSQISFLQAKNTVETFFKSNYLVIPIYPEQIINDDWEENTALLIIPGGADLYYCEALNGHGNQRIKSYVECGGKYLGICAGSYYGGNFVEFAKGTAVEVLGKRELAFFSGTVLGPVLAHYDYNNFSGAMAAKILCQCVTGFTKKSELKVFYNGGGFFVDAINTYNTKVLATYDNLNQEAAIIECCMGNGKAILSGVHFEYDPSLLDAEDEYLKEIIPELKKTNKQRLKLAQYIFERLGLNDLLNI